MPRSERKTQNRVIALFTDPVWGRRDLLTVREDEAKPSVGRSHRRITLTVRPGSSRATAVMPDS